MRIQQLKLENFRGFEKLVIDFPENGSAVLIGVNGAGKSSILEAVGILLNSLLKEFKPLTFLSLWPMIPTFLSNDDIKQNHTQLLIGADFKYDTTSFYYPITFPAAREKVSNNIKKQYLDKLPFFTFFRSNRTISKDENNNDIFDHTGIFDRLTSFDNFITWFEERENFENQRKLEWFEKRENPNYQKKLGGEDFNYIDKDLDTVRKALVSFLNKIPNAHFSNLKMKRYEQNGKKTSFQSDVKSFLSIAKNGQDFKINQLSDGEKMSIMLVCDTARKLTISNPEYNNPLQGEGIVLIDEIDLHLHPAWQRAIIPALEKTFPNIQFIITTHSPQVLSTIHKENVFILEDFKLVEETPYTFGHDSNSILYSIFGVEKRPEEAAKEFKNLYRLIDNEKLEDAEEMLEKMKKKYGYYDTDIVRAKMHIDFNNH